MKVLCFGSLNIDYTYSVDHFVQKGETLSSTGLQVFTGGKVYAFGTFGTVNVTGTGTLKFGASDFSVDNDNNVHVTDADAAAAEQLLQDVRGTYDALFPVITATEYDQVWLDACAEVVGDEAAPEVAEMLKAACNGTI